MAPNVIDWVKSKSYVGAKYLISTAIFNFVKGSVQIAYLNGKP